MRKIERIIIHCTATPQGRDVTVREIDQWHRERGMSKIGYHYVIGLNGTIYPGRKPHEQGAHCTGYNATSIGICYIGGIDNNGIPCDTRTAEQKQSIKTLVASLSAMYTKATVHGHNEFSDKMCPCFNVAEEF